MTYSNKFISPHHTSVLQQRIYLLDTIIIISCKLVCRIICKISSNLQSNLPTINSSHLKDSDSSFKLAFVNFSSIEDAKIAVKAINRRYLEGHSLIVKIQDEEQFRSKMTSPLQPAQTGKSSKGKTIKVSNISECFKNTVAVNV